MIFQLVTADPLCLARADKASLPKQMLMELLVESLQCRDVFRGINDDFVAVCFWYGLGLDGDGNITSINWRVHDVPHYDDIQDGLIDEDALDVLRTGGSIDFQWIPETVTHFHLYNMMLSGSIDTVSLPRTLQIFRVEQNVLSGTFDTRGLPHKIEEVSIANNRISGSLNITTLPVGLRAFHASGNLMSGSLDMSSLPDGIKRLSLHNNSFTGVIDLLHLPRSLKYLHLEVNRMKQDALVVTSDLPNLRSLTLDAGQATIIVDNAGRPVGKEMMSNSRTIQLNFGF
ncbi:leucine-rich repeat protein [Perkinsela sp. CCAP 1560/4]|nr:leucine-rich repeat protein [Perkinsela sp. CCAP 1560/4]|eukprot:KNH05030.1 leucine-rich repeat protein [Perkinsela sp. CCAP 1560/4]